MSWFWDALISRLLRTVHVICLTAFVYQAKMISWSLKPRRVFAVFLLFNTLWHDICEVKILVVKVFEIMTHHDRSERVFIMLLVFVCPSKPPSGYCVGQAANQSLGPWSSCWCLCGYAHLWYGCLNHVCHYLSRQNVGDSNLSSSKPLRIYAFQMCQIQGRGTHFWLISAISLNRTAWNHSVLGNRSWMSHLSWLLQSWRAWRILAPPIMADLGYRSTSNHQFLLNRCWLFMLLWLYLFGPMTHMTPSTCNENLQTTLHQLATYMLMVFAVDQPPNSDGDPTKISHHQALLMVQSCKTPIFWWVDA